MTRRLIGMFTAVVALAVLAPVAGAAVTLTQIFNDPFGNASSQHATAVEPDTFAYGTTMVMGTQSGRFYDGGGTGIGWATTTNSGATWTSGTLPGITSSQGTVGSPYERVSDPSVAYDAAHNVWMISSIPILPDTSVPTVFVSRSTDGGRTWANPVSVTTAAGDFDKNWTACDNGSTSPFRGNCYTTFDNFGDGDRLKVSTSTDGGLTWGTPKNTANNATGLGGQPVVQPNGTVIIPAANASETGIIAYRSTDGGVSWSSTVSVSPVSDHAVAGGLRTSALPSAEISADGTVYTAWQDCRFRRSCRTNDIVYSTSSDGLTWSSVKRVPIDATNSSVDHFIPGIAVTGSGSTTRLGLTYYFYRDGRCGSKRTPCQLEVGYIQSDNGGSTWSNHTDVAGPFPVSQVPDTSQGRMVGDYISTSWMGGRAFGSFAVAKAPPAGSAFDQALYVPTGGSAASSGAFVNTSNGDRVVAGAASDHAAPRSAIRHR
jgi:hypothetical protein